ncbi:cupin fold metalloprotein, WbuC family [Marinomonas sp. CT5]|uniref:WbuC family cupin fold metalloprotein n=1 Tax=Marinomonas sp. CT5 TaxID=2066133 RepID=UPI0017FB6ABA|nr:WbuC family cupin fold metalloprotein [Marinomonas sp. CT5]NVK72323.1 WbuC family cupin fold metalloprotein [Oceanospirillaceae bacterium]QUX94994.1 cupin fold metalloprotein, WbuC family [Marinomonas sp. CT5]
MNKLSFDKLSTLSDTARQSSRQRMNHNIHSELSDPVQRLAIAMEPDTYIRPHRHLQTWELLTALRGRFVVLTFDDNGVVIDRAVLGESESVIETPVAGWHAVLSLDTDAVIFEVKQGPYAPFKEEDFAPWSPAADDENHKALMAWYRDAEIGQQWSGC